MGLAAEAVFLTPPAHHGRSCAAGLAACSRFYPPRGPTASPACCFCCASAEFSSSVSRSSVPVALRDRPRFVVDITTGSRTRPEWSTTASAASSACEVYDQVNACSCLTLILACIVYWQARDISRIAAAPDFPFDPDLLRHVSPIEWKNVILYDESKIDPAKLKLREP